MQPQGIPAPSYPHLFLIKSSCELVRTIFSLTSRVGFDIFLSAMDKAVKRHILRKRVVLAKRSDEPMTFTERTPEFFKWFEEDVMGFDSEEYRREYWREAYRSGHRIGHMPHTLCDELNKHKRSDFMLIDLFCITLLMGGAFAIWVMRRKIDQHIHRLRRPSYYETERARRLSLTAQRRRIRRRTTVNPCPTAEQLKDALIHARESVGNMIRLGSLMEDLECYIDNSLVFDEGGKIVARKGGIRRYIQSEIPDLYKSYKTLMRYKALARRFRQVVGISDPMPASCVLPKEDENADGRIDIEEHKAKGEKSLGNIENGENNATKEDGKTVENMVRTNSQRGGVRVCDGGSGGGSCERVRLNDEIRKVVKEVLDVCEGTFLNLSAVLALRICEDTIPHESYKNVLREICA